MSNAQAHVGGIERRVERATRFRTGERLSMSEESPSESGYA